MNPADDLAKRCKLQHALWENILALRSGRYYNVKQSLVPTLDECHLTHVSPTNTVVNDEGAQLRRILGAFGLNTILFKLKTDPQVAAAASIGVPSLFVPTLRDEERTSFDSVITIDMADWRSRNGNPYSFQEALSQKTYYLDEKDRYVSVQTEVIGVYKLLSFFVPRRKTSVVHSQGVAPGGIAATMINFSQLPLTISGLSELNNYPVDAPASIRAGNYVLRKRSVLVNESVVYTDPSNAANQTELVTSTSTIVYTEDSSKCYYYNPTGVVRAYVGQVAGPNGAAVPGVGRPGPISEINQVGDVNGVADLNAAYLEKHQGTLFFYQTSD
jgi:hypothetical protein